MGSNAISSEYDSLKGFVLIILSVLILEYEQSVKCILSSDRLKLKIRGVLWLKLNTEKLQIKA